MKKYFKTSSIFGHQEIIILKQEERIISFAENPENPDWQQYQEWLLEGNSPEPWNPEE